MTMYLAVLWSPSQKVLHPDFNVTNSGGMECALHHFSYALPKGSPMYLHVLATIPSRSCILTGVEPC